jgi:hypothetical protein
LQTDWNSASQERKEIGSAESEGRFEIDPIYDKHLNRFVLHLYQTGPLLMLHVPPLAESALC